MLKYKIDVLTLLKQKGYSSYNLRKTKILSEGTLQKFRKGEIVSPETLNKLCIMLNIPLNELIEYVEVDDEIAELNNIISKK